MPFTIGHQGNFNLEIKGFDTDKNGKKGKPFCFKIDRLDYPTVTNALKNCPILASRLNPELMNEILGKMPEDGRKTVIEKIDQLQDIEYKLIIKLIKPYFPPKRRKMLNFMIYDELVNLFYYLATGNEEIQSLTEIMNELEGMQTDHENKVGLRKGKKKSKKGDIDTT